MHPSKREPQNGSRFFLSNLHHPDCAIPYKSTSLCYALLSKNALPGIALFLIRLINALN